MAHDEAQDAFRKPKGLRLLLINSALELDLMSMTTPHKLCLAPLSFNKESPIIRCFVKTNGYSTYPCLFLRWRSR
jgi:hypothetical protein